MRSTNEPADPFVVPAKPKPDPKPKGDTWSKTDSKGIERNQDGRLRTNLPPNNTIAWSHRFTDAELDHMDAWQC